MQPSWRFPAHCGFGKGQTLIQSTQSSSSKRRTFVGFMANCERCQVVPQPLKNYHPAPAVTISMSKWSRNSTRMTEQFTIGPSLALLRPESPRQTGRPVCLTNLRPLSNRSQGHPLRTLACWGCQQALGPMATHTHRCDSRLGTCSKKQQEHKSQTLVVSESCPALSKTARLWASVEKQI